MKKLICTLALCAIALSATAANLEWMTDFPKAQEKAKKEKKWIMMDFTGSDWCPWCIKLEEEILSKPEFVEFAKKHLVMVYVDFPRKKQLPESQVAANKALSKKYSVKGFPTLVILNSEGKHAGEMGYMQGGAKPFIAELQKLTGK